MSSRIASDTAAASSSSIRAHAVGFPQGERRWFLPPHPRRWGCVPDWNFQFEQDVVSRREAKSQAEPTRKMELMDSSWLVGGFGSSAKVSRRQQKVLNKADPQEIRSGLRADAEGRRW
jgi:hypothetical protein